MTTKALKPPVSNLYDQDFAAWTHETARLLRQRRFEEIDIEHAAEELEDMGASQKHEVHSRLRVLTIHLLKWKYQSQKRSRSWHSTIATQRAELDDVFGRSPSLRGNLSRSVAEVYSRSVELASIETGLPEDTFPHECPFTAEQIMDRGFLPD